MDIAGLVVVDAGSSKPDGECEYTASEAEPLPMRTMLDLSQGFATGIVR